MRRLPIFQQPTNFAATPSLLRIDIPYGGMVYFAPL